MGVTLAMTVKRNNITAVERQALMLFANGYVAKEIARDLFTTQRTVETMMQRTRSRFNAKNMSHMIYIAMRRGLIG